MPASTEAITLARRLRALREHHFGVRVTQQVLAAALSQEQPVGPPTISTWENRTEPVTPPASRLRAYARFFASPRSLEPEPRLLKDSQLDAEERADLERLEAELLALREHAVRPQTSAPAPAPPSLWVLSDAGPVTIICPDLPAADRIRMSDSADPNFTDLYNYADVDALIELFGHVRASNPGLRVYFRRASQMIPDDLSGHVVLLGGVAWNSVTRRVLGRLDLPVRQVRDDRVPTGEVFEIKAADGAVHRFLPEWAATEPGDTAAGTAAEELVEDVGLFARVPNPTNSHCTLTVCNGIHSRGVLGAVRLLTDARLRDANETIVRDLFADLTSFGLLLKVDVVGGRALTPDLAQVDRRLYTWPGTGRAVA